MQGKSRSKKTASLSYIFFKIRSTRDTPTRRSWQRRARLALDALDYLTPAERHEISACWSKSDVTRINSPALRKLFSRKDDGSDWETIPAKKMMRAAFDADGQKIPRTKKPGLATRLDYGPAANEPWPVLQLSLIS